MTKRVGHAIIYAHIVVIVGAMLAIWLVPGVREWLNSW